ncbi:MAG: thermosome subunit [Candidatus Korarchaeota archaeon]|nr:thermosome subunit [Candidatus Korarchaeota archaeon]NIU83339.1 thermosome subunit [Candidatus Thorarchaeota archaeon]NIW13670.1 thermosome subunit [Candidatus Thorarchaeota archaeon]NIW51769.1 thermosome subunit [Candidatus Korarchaeota archaeon]
MSYIPSSGNIPILVLREKTRRERGREAIERNVTAAKSIADIVRSTFGPRGMNKLIVDSLGDLIITNDGATILDELDIEHPAAKLVVEASKSQDDEAGDGTTTAAILIGELLSNARTLLDRGIHQTIIVRVYRKMLDKAKDILKNTIALDVNLDEKEQIQNVIISALNSKLPRDARRHFAEIVYQAAKRAFDPDRGLDLDLISIIQKEGKSLLDSELAPGIVIDKKIVHPEMPRKIENVKVALINQNIEVEKGDVLSDVTLDRIEAFEKLRDRERKKVKGMIDRLSNLGVGAVFCQKGISDNAQDLLAKRGILAVRRCKKSDIRLLSKTTGAKIVNSLDDLSEEDLGSSTTVEQKNIAGDKLVFVNTEGRGAATVIIRGATKHVTDEAERAFHDAISVTKDIAEDNKMIPACVEIPLALHLDAWKEENITGKERIVASAFIGALNEVPKALIENAGGDMIEDLENLKLKNKENPGSYIYDAITRELRPNEEAKLYDPLRVKLNAISTATETAISIIRIDDVIAASEKERPGGPGGMPGGPGGMPGGMPGGPGGMPGGGGLPGV